MQLVQGYKALPLSHSTNLLPALYLPSLHLFLYAILTSRGLLYGEIIYIYLKNI